MSRTGSLLGRIEREARKNRRRRRVAKFLFGADYTVVHRSELDNLYGYVSLTNDLMALARRAGDLCDQTQAGDVRPSALVLLAEQVEAYRRGYPEHPR